MAISQVVVRSSRGKLRQLVEFCEGIGPCLVFRCGVGMYAPWRAGDFGASDGSLGESEGFLDWRRVSAHFKHRMTETSRG